MGIGEEGHGHRSGRSCSYSFILFIFFSFRGKTWHISVFFWRMYRKIHWHLGWKVQDQTAEERLRWDPRATGGRPRPAGLLPLQMLDMKMLVMVEEPEYLKMESHLASVVNTSTFSTLWPTVWSYYAWCDSKTTYSKEDCDTKRVL